MRRFFSLLVIICLSLTLVGCQPYQVITSDKLQVVCTLFPYYDFVRQIAGDKVDITLLVGAGKEAHSFEPTPMDIITISQSDLFIYNGGESELWVEDILSSSKDEMACILNMMEFSSALYAEEEIVDGVHVDSHDEEEEDEEIDEHIWTSPIRSMELVRAITDTLIELDESNASFYQKNLDSYLERLATLDTAFSQVVQSGNRSILIFGDRFPFLYFCKEYNLDYAAAFHGCSSDTEPSLATLKTLIDRVSIEDIPVVYTLELSNQKIANAICETTGAKVMTFYSCQTISRQDFLSGETYESLMWKNVDALKEGLA